MGWELEELEQAAHLVAAEDSGGSCGEESSGSEDGERETESELDSSTRTTHTEERRITSKSGSEKSSIEDSECVSDSSKVVCEVASDEIGVSESLSQTEDRTSGQGSRAVCQAATNKDPNSLSHEQTHHSTCEIDRLSEGLRDLLTLKQPTTQATEGVTPSSTHQKLIEELN